MTALSSGERDTFEWIGRYNENTEKTLQREHSTAKCNGNVFIEELAVWLGLGGGTGICLVKGCFFLFLAGGVNNMQKW